MTKIKELFSVETNDCIVRIAMVNRVLWILTGKQDLFRCYLGKQPGELEFVDCGCTVFKVHGNLIAHDKDEFSVLVRAVDDLAVKFNRQFTKSLTEVHQVCFVNDSIVAVASNEGIELWDYKMGRSKILRTQSTVAMDMCYFGSDLIVSKWDLLRINVDTAETELLDAREYDVEYPFKHLCNFQNQLLAISSTALQIVDKNLFVVVETYEIQAVESIFADHHTLIVRVGGRQPDETEIKFTNLPCGKEHAPGFKVGIAYNSLALASDSTSRLLAISRGNRVIIGSLEN